MNKREIIAEVWTPDRTTLKTLAMYGDGIGPSDPHLGKQMMDRVKSLTYQMRALPEEDCIEEAETELLRSLRAASREERYEDVLALYEANSDDIGACIYGSIALRGLGRLTESLVPAAKALSLANDLESTSSDEVQRRKARWLAALALNLVGTRIDHLTRERDLAEQFFAEAWRRYPNGRRNGWFPIANRCEIILSRSKGRGDLRMEAVSQVDDLMKELLDHFEGWDSDNDFLLYLRNHPALEPYRASRLWAARFGSALRRRM